MTLHRWVVCTALLFGLGLPWLGRCATVDAATCPPQAAVPTPQQLSDAAAHAVDHGFLWRIRRDGHDSFLFGTVHVARFEWMFPGSALKQALQSIDTLALELDLQDPDIRDRLARAMRAASTPATPDLRDRLRRLLRDECLPEHAMDELSPQLQVDALATLIGRRDGLDPQYGIDNFLAGWAHGANLPVVSLETPELQAQLLQMDESVQSNTLLDVALKELESGAARATLRRMAQVWADSDLRALTRYADWCACMDSAAERAEMARMLDDRNPALADSIAGLHRAGRRVFAAVGSLHMIGPTGLPALLRRQGFEVEQLRP